MGGLSTVTLDAMGTLVTLEPPVPRLVTALADHGVAVTEEAARRALAAEIAYYRAHHDDGRDAALLAGLRHRCAEVLGRELPPPARALGTETLVEVLLSSLRFAAYPEVPEVLKRLRGGGLRLVVVSNWDVSLHEALSATGLAPLLDAVHTSAEAGAAKPAAAIFERALAGADPATALHVGDSVDADVDGPLGVGMGAVLVDREGVARETRVPVVSSLRALPGLLVS